MQAKPGYEALENILQDALNQAQSGKGKDRHAGQNEPFLDQQIMEMSRRQRNISGPAYQAHKKLYEAEGMFGRSEYSAAKQEILGAIVYASAMVAKIDESVEDLRKMSETLTAPGPGIYRSDVYPRAHAFKNPIEY